MLGVGIPHSGVGPRSSVAERGLGQALGMPQRSSGTPRRSYCS